EAFTNRGNAQFDLGNFTEALANYDRALLIKPDFAPALDSKANLLIQYRLYDEAIDTLKKLLAAHPEQPYARGNLLHCRMYVCDWRYLDRESEGVAAGIRANKLVPAPFPFQAIATSPADVKQCSEVYAWDKCPPAVPLAYGKTYRHERIRI